MNKKQWLAATDPEPMLRLLTGGASNRKLRLFAVACCRRAWARFAADPVSRDAVELAERCADGRATIKQCHLARASVEVLWGYDTDSVVRAVRRTARGATKPKAAGAALDTAREARALAGYAATAHALDAGRTDGEARAVARWAVGLERSRQVESIRCLFGNPFRPVAVDPDWLTSTVLLLARGIYDEHAFDRTPILADALQDAGCNNDDLLNHFRHDAAHARGCWALDLLLRTQ